MVDAHLGYKFAVDKLNGPPAASDNAPLPTDLHITDGNGNRHRILFDYSRLAHNCSDLVHKALFRDLVKQAHFVFGSSPIFANNEARIAADAQRLLYHCCITPDSMYEQVSCTVLSITWL